MARTTPSSSATCIASTKESPTTATRSVPGDFVFAMKRESRMPWALKETGTV